MALFDNTSFSMLEKGLNAAWYKQKITLQNIANDSTPNYKAKDVEFSAVLKDITKNENSAMKSAVVDGNIENPIDLRVTVTTDQNTNQTLDGNNVDMEKEQIALSDTQFLYSTLINKVNGEFSMIKAAIQK